METPAHLDLDAGTADGNLAARGLNGNLQVHSGDGSVMLEDVHGDASSADVRRQHDDPTCERDA